MYSSGDERRREAVADADVEVGHLLEPVRGHDVVGTADGVGYPDAAPFEVGGRRVAHVAALDEQIEVGAQPPPELAAYRGVRFVAERRAACQFRVHLPVRPGLRARRGSLEAQAHERNYRNTSAPLH